MAEQTVDLTAYANQTIVLRWKYVSVGWAWWWEIDNVRTETIVAPPPPPAFVWTENFDGVIAPALPASWSVVDTSGTAGDWVSRTASVHPDRRSLPLRRQHADLQFVDREHAATRRGSMKTTGENLTTGTGYVSLWMYHDTGYTNADVVQVQYSTDGGTTWTNIGSTIPRYTGVVGWDSTRSR